MIESIKFIKARGRNDEAVVVIVTDTQEVSMFASELMQAAELLGDALLSAIESPDASMTIEVTP